MRIGRGLALLGALLVVLGLSVAAPASARTQAADPCATVSTRAAGAGTVFVGTTTSVTDGVVDLRVTDVYKGAPGSAVRLASSDPAWRADRQYLVFATGTGPRLAPDRCGTPVPVADDVLAAVAGALGPATPLGRGSGAEFPPSSEPSATPTTPVPTASSTPTSGDGNAQAAGQTDDGSTTSRLLLGIVLGVAILGSFLLPQLRRHNRERRRRRREGTDTEPDDPDLSPEWRDR